MTQEYMKDYENINACLERQDYEGAANHIALFEQHKNSSTSIAIMARVSFAAAMVAGMKRDLSRANSLLNEVINISPEPELREMARQQIAETKKNIYDAINDVMKRYKEEH